ncbi:MAG: PQQ-binding-like beta-propeller repeat protein, partial [Anaerohalosphaera sp.]|nr:PQQ-binding-like beta-propeller repeat protein [Anaerohalosphaera sp.]
GFAPTVVDGRVYVGSDDGRVYCLDAKDGKEIWRYRAVKEDRQIPGNGRIISMWPVRTGVVIEGDIAYFAAGLFPSQKVFLCAVNAKDGSELWIRQIDASAQGYMLAGGGKLYVTSGRTKPSAFDITNGKALGSFSTAGGGFVLLADDMLINGPGRGAGSISVNDSQSKANIATFGGIGMVIDGKMAYLHSHEEISALDRVRYRQLAERRAEVNKRKAEIEKKIKAGQTDGLVKQLEAAKTMIARINKEMGECVKWKSPVACPYGLIKAGGLLFAGGENKVVAIDAKDGKEVWTGKVFGKAYGLAAADGKLLVSTDAGYVYSFGNENNNQNVMHFGAYESLVTSRDDMAKYILKKSGIRQGYCFVLNGDIELGCELSQNRNLQVVCVVSDAKKATEARILTARSYEDVKVVVHVGDVDKLPYADYIANLVICDGDVKDADEVFRVVRPDGGVVVAMSKTQVDSKKWKAVGELTLETDKAEGMNWLFGVRRPLPGAGEWTHMYGDAENTACSMDQLVKGQMAVQWFGEPGPREMIDRHHRNVLPLYKDGRLFAPGDEIVYAVDAYNGTVEWDVRVPDSRRLGVFLDAGSMVVDDDNLYVVAGDKCLGFDVETGKESLTHNMPQLVEGQASEWGYIAYDGSMLFGSGRKGTARYTETSWDGDNALWYLDMQLVGSDYLFGMDRKTGDVKWKYKNGLIITTTITVAKGKVYFVETTSQTAMSDKTGRMPLKRMLDGGQQRLVAIDAATGDVVFTKPLDVSQFDQVVYLNYAKDVVLLSGSKQAGKVLDYSFYGFDCDKGEIIWHQTHRTDLPADGGHGEQNRHPTIVGEIIYAWPYAYNITDGSQLAGWKFNRKGHGCGGVSASANSLFWRGNNPWMYDLRKKDGYSRLNSVTRPGCWINIIPAGGLVLIPESSSGCTCDYAMQMSMAFAPVTAGIDHN